MTKKYVWIAGRGLTSSIERMITFQDALRRTNHLAKRAVDYVRGPKTETAEPEDVFALSRPIEERDVRLTKE